MEWDVRFDPALAEEAKEFTQAAQVEIAALLACSGNSGHSFAGRTAIR